MTRLAGKRALVTAAAQGIGAATVRAFAREGAERLSEVGVEKVGDEEDEGAAAE